MPERRIDLLFHFLHQKDGRLSSRAREQEFEPLTDREAERIEEAYRATFKQG